MIVHNLTWDKYQQLLQSLPQTRHLRLAYDRGTLEITIPLEPHEFTRELISLFIRVLVTEMGLKLKTMGSTTLSRPDLERGVEPDCAYYIQNQAKVIGRTVNLAQDPPPDLVVEVDFSHSDLNKNQLYAALGVPEFWRYNGQEWQIFQLQEDRYIECETSPTFPWVAKSYLYNFLAQAQGDEAAAELAWPALVQHQSQGQK
ncbi:Uma2 family endonuclease [Thermosynechococcaceae cyanobacterium BACA0444]|uniref:Uma2 family endonuclease n=1 Tax=Pseudocalidococcus azoricus BACA0444 TaxID=2918990 RepID=A0AAE4JUS8_9CYAN|nr:Uma2 family endonuclease [Pseudocalidococcus azoricus]MDS3859346.1 Uma2 family endonuclease [Pseudocalidococcus azoricus BACA0444]